MKNKNKFYKNTLEQKFTLVELLVVIAILAILAGLLIPVLQNSKEKSKQSKCLGQLKQIGYSINMYTIDNDEYLPAAARLNSAFGLLSLRKLLIPYMDNPKIFECPADDAKTHMFTDTGTSYEWNTFLSAKKINRLTMTIMGLKVTAPILGDAERYHPSKTRNYLYPDGRATSSLEILIH